MKFTKEFIALQRRLINNSKVINLHYWGWGFAQEALDEIERLQAHEEECHKLIDKVLDNCNVGMCTGNSSLVFRLAELVSYYSSLQAENEKLREYAKGLIGSLPDSEVDMCSDVWGWTNIAVLKHWRDKLQQALNDMETCPECGGSCYKSCMGSNGGMTQIPCGVCGGSGEVTK